jgi:predicted AlkP superfamily phosphohydrolase/phosphomutase
MMERANSNNTEGGTIKNKAFVIGLDGGTFALLGPWIEEGQLPHLKAMMRDGISGDLESTVPPVTGPAWISFITGKNPGKHGIYEFKIQDRNSYRYHIIDLHARSGRTIWDYIGDQGGRVVVLNLPTTYPPDKVNGAMIGGFMTPAGKRDFVHPVDLLEEIEKRFGPYPLYPPVPFFAFTGSDADTDLFLQELTRALEYQFEVALYLVDKLDPDFLFLHIHGSDLIGHWLWHILDREHPEFRPSALEKYGAKILDYHRRFDSAVGRLAGKAGQEANLFIVSDHGMGPIHKAIDLNLWLLQEGYLVLKANRATRVKYALWKNGLSLGTLLGKKWIRVGLGKLARRVMKSGNNPLEPIKRSARARIGRFRLTYHDVDWSRTRAFSSANVFGQIIINTKGVWSQGCVSTGAEYQALRDEIVGKLGQLRDPETGQPVGGEFFIKEDVYHGPYMDDAPDITFFPLPQKYLAGGFQFASNKTFFTLPGMTGFHRMNGILMGSGAGLRAGASLAGARIIDLAPSLLHLMGLAIPKDMDGEVLTEMFTGSFLRENPIRFMDEVRGPEKTAATLTAEEEADVMERLKGLGYLE